MPSATASAPASWVSTHDDTAVARVATDHLLALGHREIAHIGQSRDGDPGLDIPTLRRRGIEAALQDAGIRPAGFATGDFTIEGGYRAAQELLRGENRPTAIFAASDELAFGALFAVRDAGQSVPGDVSVVGVDGHELSGFFGLTTIERRHVRRSERRKVPVHVDHAHFGPRKRLPRHGIREDHLRTGVREHVRDLVLREVPVHRRHPDARRDRRDHELRERGAVAQVDHDVIPGGESERAAKRRHEAGDRDLELGEGDRRRSVVDRHRSGIRDVREEFHGAGC